MQLKCMLMVCQIEAPGPDVESTRANHQSSKSLHAVQLIPHSTPLFVKSKLLADESVSVPCFNGAVCISMLIAKLCPQESQHLEVPSLVMRRLYVDVT